MATSTPIRLVHTADLHLGLENYGRWDAAAGLHARLGDHLATLDQAVAHAIASEADVFLIAGDIYQSKHPAATHQREFARRVHRLTSAGVAVVLLVGNHDQPNRAGDANPLDIYASLELPGVTLFRRPGLCTIETRRGPLQVAGLPHLPRSFMLARQRQLPGSLAETDRLLEAALAEIVAALAADVDPAVPAVLTAHLSVDVAVAGSESQLMLGRGPTLPLGVLANPAFDYVALGHIHKPQVLGARPPCVYPGSLDRVDFGEADDDKGFYEVSLRRGEADWTRVSVSVRPFVTLRADLRESSDPTADLLKAVADSDVEGAVVRLSYTLQADRAAEVREAEIVRALAGAFDVAWRPELVRAAARTRLPDWEEALAGDPLAALTRYMELRPELADQQDRLLAHARALLAEEAS